MQFWVFTKKFAGLPLSSRILDYYVFWWLVVVKLCPVLDLFGPQLLLKFYFWLLILFMLRERGPVLFHWFYSYSLNYFVGTLLLWIWIMDEICSLSITHQKCEHQYDCKTPIYSLCAICKLKILMYDSRILIVSFVLLWHKLQQTSFPVGDCSRVQTWVWNVLLVTV